MGTKTPLNQSELYKRIDEILYYEWDPIGVSNTSEARDEYHSYLPRVFAYAMEVVSPDTLAAYLEHIVTTSMGLGSQPEFSRKIASHILSARDECIGSVHITS